MKKIVLGALLVLLLTIGFGVYYLLSNLDSLVKTAIETYGSQATQTAVRVERVKIGLQDGFGTVQGLRVDNPEGFVTPQAFSFGEITLQVDLDSLAEAVVVIDAIVIQSPDVFFELNNSGDNNLKVLKENLSTPSSGSSQAGGAGQSEPKLIIRRLTINEGAVHALLVPINREETVRLSTVELSNLGGKRGATPTQITDQVLNAVANRALSAVEKSGLEHYREKLEKEIQKRLGSEKDRIDKNVRESLQGFLDK